ncbi:hypothetical protein [Lacrimispora sp.]|uniref:hypothetical protein n=1 Tax=Lacrimispora sp. TaxID=2719234 RepID=UPI002FDB68EE
MTEEVRKYAEMRILESGIRRVPGHYPEFESKEHVDQWLKICKVSFEEYLNEPLNLAALTEIDLDEYQELLDRLKRNKENVPLELLLTKYRKSYNQLRETLQAMTKQILQDIVFSGLKIERGQAYQKYIGINTAIRESGVLEKVSHAVCRQYSADRVLEYALQLREMVHRIVKGSEING